MRILIAGADVIGTVCGAHLGAAGHAISVPTRMALSFSSLPLARG
jgi:ketopantoate reductase